MMEISYMLYPYALGIPKHHPKTFSEKVDAIVAEVQRHRQARHVVLTGGEPMIAKEIATLAAELKMLGYHLTIETAGTIAPGGIACDLASVSPKLLNSTPHQAEHAAWRKKHEAIRWQPAVVRAWLDQASSRFAPF